MRPITNLEFSAMRSLAMHDEGMNDLLERAYEYLALRSGPQLEELMRQERIAKLTTNIAMNDMYGSNYID